MRNTLRRLRGLASKPEPLEMNEWGGVEYETWAEVVRALEAQIRLLPGGEVELTQWDRYVRIEERKRIEYVYRWTYSIIMLGRKKMIRHFDLTREMAYATYPSLEGGFRTVQEIFGQRLRDLTGGKFYEELPGSPDYLRRPKTCVKPTRSVAPMTGAVHIEPVGPNVRFCSVCFGAKMGISGRVCEGCFGSGQEAAE